MRLRIVAMMVTVIAIAVLVLGAQEPDMKQKFAQAQKANGAALRQFTWKSRTVLNLKGETKKMKVDQVVFDSSGQQQKTLLEESPQGEQQVSGGRLKKKIVAKKKEEFAELMQDLVQLVTSYAHIPPEQMQAFVKNASFSLGQAPHEGTLKIAGQNAVEPGDAMNIWVDKQTLMMRRVEITTAYDKNPVQVAADYQSIPNGPTYLARATVDYPEKKLQVIVENFEYQPLGPPAGSASQVQPGS
jgi:hypothetical protein